VFLIGLSGMISVIALKIGIRNGELSPLVLLFWSSYWYDSFISSLRDLHVAVLSLRRLIRSFSYSSWDFMMVSIFFVIFISDYWVMANNFLIPSGLCYYVAYANRSYNSFFFYWRPVELMSPALFCVFNFFFFYSFSGLGVSNYLAGVMISGLGLFNVLITVFFASRAVTLFRK